MDPLTGPRRVRGRRYHLTSRWRLPAPAGRCWDALADPRFSWPLWWPGVTALRVSPSPDGPVGSSATVVFRSPLRYALTVVLTVLEAEPGAGVVVGAGGDLVGRAWAVLTETGPDRTRLDLLWDVSPTRTWMLRSGPALAPLFVAAHAATMRAGERGLARYLGATGREVTTEATTTQVTTEPGTNGAPAPAGCD